MKRHLADYPTNDFSRKEFFVIWYKFHWINKWWTRQKLFCYVRSCVFLFRSCVFLLRSCVFLYWIFFLFLLDRPCSTLPSLLTQVSCAVVWVISWLYSLNCSCCWPSKAWRPHPNPVSFTYRCSQSTAGNSALDWVHTICCSQVDKPMYYMLCRITK